MQKRIIADNRPDSELSLWNWLDLEQLAEVEISSEDPAYPIEAALLPGMNQGWRANKPGTQTIRLLFKQPQQVQRIQLSFIESVSSRAQEYVLRLSQDNGKSFREIVRQQWNFSPEGATTELEEHVVGLPVTMLELIITPDISGQPAIASLDKWRVF